MPCAFSTTKCLRNVIFAHRSRWVSFFINGKSSDRLYEFNFSKHSSKTEFSKSWVDLFKHVKTTTTKIDLLIPSNSIMNHSSLSLKEYHRPFTLIFKWVLCNYSSMWIKRKVRKGGCRDGSCILRLKEACYCYLQWDLWIY